MKAETQALHLEKMMQRHKLYPEYELALSPIQVKKNALKKLTSGDLFLLGMHRLEMILLEEGNISANVVLNESGNSSKIKIIKLNRSTIKQTKETAQLNLQEVLLHVNGKNIAKGSLVNVDEEIAVQIDEVRK
jgi:flagellar motor switch/type III secretory pathway protein FliN